jgi:hypothetical protein
MYMDEKNTGCLVSFRSQAGMSLGRRFRWALKSIDASSRAGGWWLGRSPSARAALVASYTVFVTCAKYSYELDVLVVVEGVPLT